MELDRPREIAASQKFGNYRHAQAKKSVRFQDFKSGEYSPFMGRLASSLTTMASFRSFGVLMLEQANRRSHAATYAWKRFAQICDDQSSPIASGDFTRL